MDKALLDACLATRYLVCIDEVDWATIRINQALPALLQAQVGTRCWGFVTAWNPAALPRDPVQNRAALRELLAALRALPDVTIYPAIGVGRGDWSEPSLFVIGTDTATLDALCNRHEQVAYVHGCATGVAQLRELHH